MNMYNIDDLSYTAHENPEWFTRAMFGGRLVGGGYIRILTGIKGDELLSQIDITNKILQLDGKDCAWTPNQIIKLSEKKASVKTYKINLEQCINELEKKRTLYQMSPGAENDSLPPELEAATMALIAIGLSNEIEEMIIGGDSTKNPNEFDGLEKVLTSSAESIKLAGSPITKANILDKIQKVYDAIPEDVLQAEDSGTLYVFGSYATRRKLRNALAELGNQVVAQSWTIDDSDKRNPKIYYLGIEFVPVKGIGNNTLIGTEANNVFLLTDLEGDLDSVEMGQYPKPNNDKVWIKGRLRLGLAVPFEDEAVIMSTAITSDSTPAREQLTLIPTNLIFKAAGETKTATILTTGNANDIKLTIDGAVGFSIDEDSIVATAGKVVFEVEATANGGNIALRTGQVIIKDEVTGAMATLMLEQQIYDVPTIIP